MNRMACIEDFKKYRAKLYELTDEPNLQKQNTMLKYKIINSEK